MRSFFIVSNASQVTPLPAGWDYATPSPKAINLLGLPATSLDKRVYQVIALHQCELSNSQRFARGVLGVLALAFSVGLAWLSADVRSLFALKASKTFAARFDTSPRDELPCNSHAQPIPAPPSNPIESRVKYSTTPPLPRRSPPSNANKASESSSSGKQCFFQESAARASDRYKKISKEWKFQDKNGVEHIAVEEIDRIDTVKNLMTIAEKGCFHSSQQGDEHQLIARCREELKQRGWGNSDYFRDKLRGRDEISKGLDFSTRLNNYRSLVENEYLPIPINMRSHSIEIDGKKQTIVRVGVMSDMSNGFTNLREMREIKNGNKLLLGKVEKRIAKKSDKEKILGNHNISFTAAYAKEQLQLQNIDRAIERRSLHLKRQFLQLVIAHISTGNHMNVRSSEAFKMIHIGLLNHRSKEVDATGWYHNELNEMIDMAEIFNDFSGKKLIFDGAGPFIDREGDIHLSERIAADQSGFKTLTLKALYVNNSVQGHNDNDGEARKLNESAAKEFEGNSKMAKLLLGKKTDYFTAIEMIEECKSHEFNVSTGCLSGKDRTGLVCASWSVMKNLPNCPRKRREQIMLKQFKFPSPATEVVFDNTKTKIMKISPSASVPGVTDNVNGCLQRPKKLLEQGAEIQSEKKRIAKKSKRSAQSHQGLRSTTQ